MVIYIVCVVIILCSTYLGWGLSNYYKRRIVLFQNLDDFINFAISNINFFKDSVEIIINQFLNSHSLSKEFRDCLVKIKNNVEFNSILLKKNENNLLNDVFQFLGKNDSENQIVGLKNYSNQISIYLKQAEEDNKKIGSISTKLGFLLGLLIAICLI